MGKKCILKRCQGKVAKTTVDTEVFWGDFQEKLPVGRAKGFMNN